MIVFVISTGVLIVKIPHQNLSHLKPLLSTVHVSEVLHWLCHEPIIVLNDDSIYTFNFCAQLLLCLLSLWNQ